MATSAISRIMPRLHHDENGCWIWTGCKARGGYGKVFNPGGTLFVHRIVYEAFVGPIPEGLQLDHLCRVPACANPEHLEPVTAKENSNRGVLISFKRRAAWTHCIRGHEFNEQNTYIRPDGTRSCRVCNNRRDREAKRWAKGRS